MELQGSAYLYTVATIAMTYVAFTMIFIFLRQARGGSLTKFELFAARNFIKMSFIVVTGSLLPPLLSLFTLPEPLIWRLSSVALALMVIEHAVTFPKRRRAITGVRMPSGMVVAMAAFWLAAVTLGINAIWGSYLAYLAWSRPVRSRSDLAAHGGDVGHPAPDRDPGR